ncbi:MAG: apolipoprotein N-acyltransferase [Planctomycetota bacterium]
MRWLRSALRPFVDVFVTSLASSVLFVWGFLSGPNSFLVASSVLVLGIVSYAGSITRLPRWRVFAATWLGWLPAVTVAHLWVADISNLGVLPLVGYLALFPAAYAWIAYSIGIRVGARFVRRDLLFFRPVLILGALPIVWIGIEVLRGELLWGGYAFHLLAHATTVDWPVPVFGSRLGAYGVGLVLLVQQLMFFVVYAAVLHIVGRKTAGLLLGLGAGVVVVYITHFVVAFLINFVLTLGRADESDRPAVAIAVIQTNIPQSNREVWSTDSRLETLEFIERLSREAVAERPDLAAIVIPETMYPGYLGLVPEAIAEQERTPIGIDGVPAAVFPFRLLTLQAELGVPMLVGAEAIEDVAIIENSETGRLSIETGDTYNSAFVIADGRVHPQRFDKIHLTPFGEVMPLISRWEWLEQRLLAIGARGMTFGLSKGERFTTVELGESGDRQPLRAATPICFEATSSRTVRRLVYDAEGERQADVIINLTNDGWFSDHDAGREAHLLAVRWRAIELGTPIVRAANTGISCVIDAHGRVIERLEPRTEGLLIAEVPIAVPNAAGSTAYARYGNVVGWACLVITIGITVWTFVPARRRASAEAGVSDESDKNERTEPASDDQNESS